MSFGQKNPWQRAPGGNQINPILQGLAGQQFGNLPGMIPNINAFVNQAAFGSMLGQAASRPPLIQSVNQNPPRSHSPQNKKRSFVGSITKFLDSYGFIDDEVFFQATVVSGGHPSPGARCMVEAIYNSSMPFHWNATSVQIIPDNNAPSAHSNPPRARPMQSGNRWDPPPNGNDMRGRDEGRYGSHVTSHRDSREMHRRPTPPRREPILSRPPRRSPPPRRRSPSKSPPRRVEKRERSPRLPSPRRERESTRDREPSPPRRRARMAPRYICKPVRALASRHLKCAELRSRYVRMYVPSDFISVEMNWLDSFSLEAPFQIGLNPVNFHVLHKDVDLPEDKFSADDLAVPGDEDHRFVVRVLLLSHAGIADLRKKVYGLLPDGSVDENNENIPYNKAVSFLTGIRGRNEVMAIGGAYSPSLDGPNPLDLPTMIKTAVRTTRELVGVDLQDCPTWYKVAHLEYYRAERDRVDNVVLLMPDTSSMSGLMPTAEEHAATVEILKAQLKAKLDAIDAEEFVSSVEKRKKEAASLAKEAESTATGEDGSAPATEAAVASSGATDTASTTAVDAAAADGSDIPVASESTTAIAANESADGMEIDEPQADRLHWSTSLTSLRVADLREQLALRNLDTKGVKNVLVQRLQKAFDEEREKEEGTGNGTETEPEAPETTEEAATEVPAEEVAPAETAMDVSEKVDDVVNESEEIITLDQLVEKTDDDDFTAEELEEIRREREKFEITQNERKHALTRHYQLPDEPAVFVFPNKLAKNGRFDCKVTSLHSLLEYRVEDNKEASFEVFLYSEVVREMLDRTNAFQIYKTIQAANPIDVELQKRKETLVAAKNAAVAAAAAEAVSEENTDAAKTSEVAMEVDKDIDDRDLLVDFKALVGNLDLFASFAYFDVNGCGYLAERDCEELLLSIGIRLSRGDVARMLRKVITRERFNYRIYTDRYLDKDNEVKYTSSAREDAPSLKDMLVVHEPTAEVKTETTAASTGGTPDVTENGYVIYKGAALNIKQSLERHQEMKDECTKLFTQVQEQDHVLKSYKEQVDTLEKRKKRLESDVSYYKKKAYDAEKCLKNNEDDVVVMKSALQDCKRLGDRIANIVDRVMPLKEKSKEASARPESSTPKRKGEEEVKKEPEVKAEGDVESAGNNQEEAAVEVEEKMEEQDSAVQESLAAPQPEGTETTSETTA